VRNEEHSPRDRNIFTASNQLNLPKGCTNVKALRDKNEFLLFLGGQCLIKRRVSILARQVEKARTVSVKEYVEYLFIIAAHRLLMCKVLFEVQNE
jgi:hypothetical protein